MTRYEHFKNKPIEFFAEMFIQYISEDEYIDNDITQHDAFYITSDNTRFDATNDGYCLAREHEIKWLKQEQE